ncbi:o-succinylbenzoate--CoA ligase [Vibrio gallaecicus]|uniref:O-succinylbenzoate--CoA ligase n=1 Tax=Vibrio gallaecicus TaxID=552386 RepID=A0ABV4NGS4_9VIBR
MNSASHSLIYTSSLWENWSHSEQQRCALDTPNKRYSWEGVQHLVNEYVACLNQQGLKEGDVLTIIGKNSSEQVITLLACLKMGVIAAFVMPQPEVKLQQKLDTLFAKEQPIYVWNTSSKNPYLAPQVTVVSLPKLDDISLNPVRELKSSIDEHRHHRLTTSISSSIAINTTHLSTIVFTSGSTGNPKAVVHTADQHLASAGGLLNGFSYEYSDTWLLSLPMYHVSGLAIVFRWLSAGGCLKVGIGHLEEDIKGCTHASLVATQLQRLLSAEYPLQLTHVLLGGSHIPESLAKESNVQGIETWLGYGMTEAASTVTARAISSDMTNQKKELSQTEESNTAGSILDYRAIKLVDKRIFIGGKTLASGYYHQGRVSPLTDSEGWFESKDLGVWVNDQLKVIGRADNQFISGGENIHCEEIERALNQVAGVKQSFIVPVEDTEFGFRPIAIIDCNELESDSWYTKQLNDAIERFKHPVGYYQMPKLEQQGIKVSRAQLAQWLKIEREKASDIKAVN